VPEAYPNGNKLFGWRWLNRTVAGVNTKILQFIRKSDGTEIYAIDPTNKKLIVPDTVRQVRRRCTIAEINAGVTILPALQGYKYRLVDAFAIAIGGNAAAVTSVDLMATLSSARILVSFLVAGLTRSTVLRAGAATNGVVLADGASFTANDANTIISAIKAGSDVTTATHIDLCLSYVIEAA